ncbi:MAG: PAS domain S-box protein [Gemmatimonadetes bacterium]|nr:PAS domain S-box protein [Gemmatimonadota bacterium]
MRRMGMAPMMLWALLIVAATEVAVMTGLAFLGVQDPFWASVLDGALLTVISAPLLYLGPVRTAAKRRVEEGMHQERSFMQAVLDTVPARVVVVDREGRVVYHNKTVEKTIGYALAEVKGELFWTRFLPPEELAGAMEVFGRLVSGAHPSEYENFLVSRDGSRSRIAWANTAVTDPDGSIRQVIGTGIDVTHLRDSEQELLRFKLGIERSHDVVFLTDIDGHILYVNPAFEKVYGYSETEVLGRTPRVIKSGMLPPAAYQDFWRALLSRQVVAGEIVNKTKDGRLLTVESTANPVLDQKGDILGFLAIQRDVTDRKRMEEALRASETRFRTLTEEIPIGVAVLSLDGRILYANRAICEFLGYPRDELLGEPVARFQHPEDRGRALRRIAEAARDAAREPAEYRLLASDGGLIPVEISSTRIEYEGVPALLSTVQDLSERRQLEEQFRQAQKLEAIGQLAGGIAHDFNNVLTVIQVSSDLLADAVASEDPETARDVEDLRGAVVRGKHLIRKLMAFARREELAFKPVDLGALVSEFAEPLQRLLPESIEVRLSVGDGLLPVWADARSMEQILMNFATNARDAMGGEGLMQVRVEPARLDEAGARRLGLTPGHFVRLSVTDTGVGMDEPTRAKIFEPFFTTKPVGQGTGLGLAVVYGLVKQHRGGIEVESERGLGTAMHVYLPAAEGQVISGTGGSEAIREIPGGSETILVVEDEPALRRAAQRCLERAGYTVLLAADGEEALELLKNRGRTVDLVVTDVVMPRLGGVELYHAARELDRSLRFLFATGYSSAEPGGLTDTGVPVLEKPWTAASLTRHVRDELDRGYQQRDPPAEPEPSP